MLKKRMTSAALAALLLCSCGSDVSSYIPEFKEKETDSETETEAAAGTADAQAEEKTTAAKKSDAKKTTTAASATAETLDPPEELYDFFPEIPMAADYYLGGFSEGYMDVYRRVYSGFFNHEEKITVPQGIVPKDSLADLMSMCYRSYLWSDCYENNYSYYYESDNTVSSVEQKYKTDAAREKAMYDQLISRASQIAAEASKLESDYDRLLYFHDTIILNCGYTYDGDNVHSAYGALVEGKSVCEGYAKAFELLCDLSGILCLPVSGMADNGEGDPELHSWNKVMLDGQWYNVDCTWDDSNDFEDKDYLSHAYLLVSDDYFSDSHTPNDNDFMPQPAATDGKGSWYYRSGTVVSAGTDIYAMLRAFVAQEAAGGSKELDLYCETDEVYKKLFDEWITDKDGERSIASVMTEYTEPGKTWSYQYNNNEKLRTFKLVIQ